MGSLTFTYTCQFVNVLQLQCIVATYHGILVSSLPSGVVFTCGACIWLDVPGKKSYVKPSLVPQYTTCTCM